MPHVCPAWISLDEYFCPKVNKVRILVKVYSSSSEARSDLKLINIDGRTGGIV
jgi:hypothetical protein